MWAIEVGGNDTSIGVVQKDFTQLDNFLGITATAWAYSSTGFRLSAAGESGPFGKSFHHGSVVAIKLDTVCHLCLLCFTIFSCTRSDTSYLSFLTVKLLARPSPNCHTPNSMFSATSTTTFDFSL
jgi:hypothetical protein